MRILKLSRKEVNMYPGWREHVLTLITNEAAGPSPHPTLPQPLEHLANLPYRNMLGLWSCPVDTPELTLRCKT